ncbi:hypothetical protein [Nostoc sp.]|uniref:hypothetical protein n=1 Tax=Nostoc sp. TaxID=1180 RepID=UPI002FF6D9C3
MNTTYSVVGVADSPQPQITVSLQTTGIFLGVVGSIVMLGSVAINIISKINKISFSIAGLEEELKRYASNAEKIKDLEKRLEVHLQDYVNYKDAILLDRNGLRERIDHKWQRTEDEFKEVYSHIKDLQNFLQKKDDFKIRE